jgi:NIPSNAP
MVRPRRKLPGPTVGESVSSDGPTEGDIMITCVIQYTLDPHGIEDFEKYATTWPPIIERFGGRLTGFYLPKEGANDFAVALLDFDSLAGYEQYRARLAADADAQANVAFVRQARCVLAERRSFLRKV